MLDRRFAKTLDHQGCLEFQEGYQGHLVLTNRRLERLKVRQKREPTWRGFNYYADEMVDIGTYIEEQEAIKDELEWYLRILQERLNALAVKEQYPESKQVGEDAHQLAMSMEVNS